MSIYFSRYSLNVYPQTPYFTAHLPQDYPLSAVLMKSRAFRRLPPNLRRLGELSKRWAVANGWDRGDIDEWYDSTGNELDPETGLPLTDDEIDAQWDSTGPMPELDHLAVPVFTEPPGGFPDPDTWQPPTEPGSHDDDDGPPSPAQLTTDILSRGRQAALAGYGLTDEEANAILLRLNPTPDDPLMFGEDEVVGIATGEKWPGRPPGGAQGREKQAEQARAARMARRANRGKR